eukprot:6906066-Alexandrium_andersonii.AAC.1
MSASLVGSEMCIRDRSVIAVGIQPARQLDNEQRCQVVTPMSSRTPTTVSYTHLTLPTICSV